MPLSKIWGLEYSEEYRGEQLIWKPVIEKPFKLDDKYKIGLNEKFLGDALARGVSKIVIKIGEREEALEMDVPSEVYLKQMRKARLYEDIPSLFKGAKAIRIYHFML